MVEELGGKIEEEADVLHSASGMHICAKLMKPKLS